MSWRGGWRSRGRTDLPVSGSSTFPNCEAALANLRPGGAAGSVAAPALQPSLDFGSC